MAKLVSKCVLDIKMFKLSSKLPKPLRYNQLNNEHCRSYTDNYETKKEKEMDGVVYLLGWTGSKEKNLKKYSNFYVERGFKVIHYCPPASLVFGVNPKKYLERHSYKLLNQLYQQNDEKKPLYFHCLSNGGVFMYYTLLNEIRKAKLRDLRMAGSIFDSAPSPSTGRVVSRSAYTICNGHVCVKIIVGSLAVAWIYFVVGLNTFRARCKGMKVDIENYRFYVAEALAEMPNLGPQHFLFSKADIVIPDYGVEWFMEERRKRGVKVSFTKWIDSHHVKHMVQYEDDYLVSLEKFLNSCTNSSYGICTALAEKPKEMTSLGIPENTVMKNLKTL